MDPEGQNGPLHGLRVVEFASIGPGPHCAMLLADMGAEVLRIQRPGGNGWPNPILDRGRHLLTLDLLRADDLALCLDALAQADVLIEGYRPGVMERLGLGPDALMARNPGLIYGRLTGWGQDGPLAGAAGHDINYLALSGALAAMGRPGTPPSAPLNLVGDFGGGSMFLAFGIMTALYERQSSGLGQVIDAAILDGVASMMSAFAGMPNKGAKVLDRETSLLGGAAPFYRCYECADGKFVSVGAIEAKFYAELMERIGAPQEFQERQNDTSLWPERSERLEDIFRSRTRSAWSELLDGTDCCFAPVLSFEEAQSHPHNLSRGTYAADERFAHNIPAPRLSRTPGKIRPAQDAAHPLHRWRVMDHQNRNRRHEIRKSGENDNSVPGAPA